MRPILLRIKGLNSFIEEQTIDFKRLMEPGLFGIFGPTGSGKTTILDGITLALYGEIARKSKNFVNTNCKSASVLFEFQISGAETKLYRVEREFKQDPNKEGYKTGKCRISDITTEEPVILADKVTDVNNCCIEIIGLKSDDFQRTVVLPQGRFSEFLKLEGKKRSEMLERLFRLQPYGDGLMRRLKERNDEISHVRSHLEGQLVAFSDISEEKVSEKKTEVEELEKQSYQNAKLLKETIQEYQAGKVLWDLQQEQSRYLDKERKLEEEADTIAGMEEKLALSQKAGKVYPFVEALNELEIDAAEKEQQIVEVKNSKEECEARKLEIEKLWKSWKECRDKELPVIRIKMQCLREIIQYQKDYKRLEQKETTSLLEKQQKEERLAIARQQEKKHEKTIEENQKKLEELKERQKKYEISADFRRQIQDGTGLEQQVRMGAQRIEQENADYRRIRSDANQAEQSLKQLQMILFLEEQDTEAEDIGILCDFVQLQNELYTSREQLKLYADIKEQIQIKAKERDEQGIQLEEYTRDKEILGQRLAVVTERKEQMETTMLSIQLRARVVDGEPCPVCGSVHHTIQEMHSVDISQIESLREEFKKLQSDSMDLEKKMFALHSNIAKRNEELQELEERKGILEQKIQDTTEDKIAEKLCVLSQYQSLQTSYSMLKKSSVEKASSLSVLKKEYDKLENQLKESLEKISYGTFREAAEKLQICDQTLEKLQISIKRGMEITEQERKEYEKSLTERISIEKELAVMDGNLRMAREQKDTVVKKFTESAEALKITSIKDPGLEETFHTCQIREKQIEEEYRKVEENKETETARFLELNGKYLEIHSALEALKKRINEDKVRVEQLLATEKFESVEECVKAMLSEDEFQTGQIRINEYKNELTQNQGVLRRIEEQLAGRTMSGEQWKELEDRKTKEEAAYEELKLLCSNEKQNYERMSVQWEKQKELLNQMKKIEHQESLMSELMQLFRGKKFVEYVALSKLQYISKAASHRLKEISNGNYGLEVDATGRFMICDYKNGGVKRDAFTLSGGETFLVSLSLSLALSEQVQLKGTAPLELFFLDEGFGTLDDELLEVVMTSLEKIQNKHLTVGIITHVESVKNRVPIKLLVTPSVAGMGGTKVHIEKN